MSNEKKDFLTKQVPELLKQLKADQEPSFGLMTPQHMVEHLVMGVKTSIKRYGEPPAEPTERHLGFRKFIANGAIFKHRPNDKTKDDLPELRLESLDGAIEQISVAVNRFYDHFESNPDFKPYNPMLGELGFEELETFHYMHYRYHLWQFGLLPAYP